MYKRQPGNVSMTTGNSLIRGATSLFGVRADLQFGKLKLQTVIRTELSTKRLESLGWKPEISLTEGLKKTIQDVYKRQRLCN